MSYDLAIWKRSETTKTAMLTEANNAICDGSDHPAMARFDLEALEQAVRGEFGDYENNEDCHIVCETGSGTTANWLMIQCAHSMASSVISKIVPIALKQSLLVYAATGSSLGQQTTAENEEEREEVGGARARHGSE